MEVDTSSDDKHRFPRNILQLVATFMLIVVSSILMILICYVYDNNIILSIVVGLLSGFIVYSCTFYMDAIRNRRRNLEKLLEMAIDFSTLIGSLNSHCQVYSKEFIQFIENKTGEFSTVNSIYGEIWFVDEKEMDLLFNGIYLPISNFLNIENELMFYELNNGNQEAYSNVIDSWKSSIFNSEGENIIKNDLDSTITHFLEFCEKSKI